MKSLNDLIWDEDVDLEEKKDNKIKSQMSTTCLKESCTGQPGTGIKHPPFAHMCVGF